MNTCAEFQMVCGECGSLTIKIENPESASREAIVYCGHCGASRGTMGGLRDLAVRTAPVCTENLNPDVVMVKPAEDRV